MLRNPFNRLILAAALTLPAAGALAAERVYVPLGSAGAVVVVDPADDKIVGRIEGLPAVHGLAATPDGRYLVAGSYQERPAGTAAAPPKPAGMSADEHAAHHAKRSGPAADPGATVSSVSIVRAEDGGIVRRIDVPGAVHHVAVSPDGRFAAVTHPRQDRVSAIDLASFEVVATVATGALPNYAAFAPDGGRLYVSNAGDGTVVEVDTARWKVARKFAVGDSPEHLVLTADGGWLFVNNVQDGTVSVIDVGAGKVLRTVQVGDTLHGIDLADDGRTAIVAAMGDEKLVAVDGDSGVVGTAALAPAPYHVAAVRGAGKLYVSSADAPKTWVVDQKTLKVLGEIPIGGKGHQMAQIR